MKNREAKEKAKQATKEAERQAKETAKRENKKSAELYTGTVKLAITPPVDLGQLKKLEESLSPLKDLRVLLVGGSTTEGNEIIVLIENPIPLLDILSEMSPVAQVTKKGKTIQITLKTE